MKRTRNRRRALRGAEMRSRCSSRFMSSRSPVFGVGFMVYGLWFMVEDYCALGVAHVTVCIDVLAICLYLGFSV